MGLRRDEDETLSNVSAMTPTPTARDNSACLYRKRSDHAFEAIKSSNTCLPSNYMAQEVNDVSVYTLKHETSSPLPSLPTQHTQGNTCKYANSDGSLPTLKRTDVTITRVQHAEPTASAHRMHKDVVGQDTHSIQIFTPNVHPPPDEHTQMITALHTHILSPGVDTAILEGNVVNNLSSSAPTRAPSAKQSNEEIENTARASWAAPHTGRSSQLGDYATQAQTQPPTQTNSQPQAQVFRPRERSACSVCCMDCMNSMPLMFGIAIWIYSYFAYVYSMDYVLLKDTSTLTQTIVPIFFHLLFAMMGWGWVRAVLTSPGVLPYKHMKRIAISSLSDRYSSLVYQRQPAAELTPTPTSLTQSHNTTTQEQVPINHADDRVEGITKNEPDSGSTSLVTNVDLPFDGPENISSENEHIPPHTLSTHTDTYTARQANIPTQMNTEMQTPTQSLTSRYQQNSGSTATINQNVRASNLGTPLNVHLPLTSEQAPPSETDPTSRRTQITFRIPESEMVLNEHRMLMYLKDGDNVHCPTRTMTVEQDGGVRLCRKEKLVKPDRVHHCSICERCILRYDHHCPWINNCVGFKNYKYFYCFLLYTFIFCLYVVGTGIPFVVDWLTSNDTGNTRQAAYPLLLSLVIIGGLFALMVSGLLFFHTYLISVNKTTVEHNFNPQFVVPSKRKNAYDLGLLNNWKYIMGRNPALWLIPVCNGREGDGLAYPVPEPPESQS